jgi:hypothetical protein
MKHTIKIILSTLILAMAALACGLPAIPGVSDANSPLFQDNFDGFDQTWGTGSDSTSSVEYADGGLKFEVYQSLYFVWSLPNDTDYSNVHIEVTAKNNNSDANATFGIICDIGIPDTNHYYFAMNSNGQYAIVKGEVARDDIFLTNNDQWGDSDQITKNAASYNIGADCGNGTLTFYVDGKQIASVQDASYTQGSVALFAANDEKENGAEITFDNFTVTNLK